MAVKYTLYTAMEIVINGKSITGISSFYKEINRVFMSGENWNIGESLDAFNDLLYGGFGILKDARPVVLLWTDIEQSARALGNDATRTYYLEKLRPGSPFNIDYFQKKLNELDKGGSQTYFDVIMEILAEHPEIKLIKL